MWIPSWHHWAFSESYCSPYEGSWASAVEEEWILEHWKWRPLALILCAYFEGFSRTYFWKNLLISVKQSLTLGFFCGVLFKTRQGNNFKTPRHSSCISAAINIEFYSRLNFRSLMAGNYQHFWSPRSQWWFPAREGNQYAGSGFILNKLKYLTWQALMPYSKFLWQNG